MAKDTITQPKKKRLPTPDQIKAFTRPIIALSITWTLCILAIKERIEADDFVKIALFVLAFYFAEKAVMRGVERANGTGSGE